MKIAFIGQKGLPATSGGVERHCEELASELAALGHDVTVFSRPSYSSFGSGHYRGIRVIEIPTVPSKHLDAIVHSVLSTLWCLGRRFDVVHYHGVGPAMTTPISRLRRGVTIATIHAEDWRQAKWGAIARLALRFGEFCALRFSDAVVVVSTILQDKYQALGYDVVEIPNGASISEEMDGTVLDELGLEKDGYFLFVGRLIKDKGVHELAEAWRLAGRPGNLVVVGASSNTNDYASTIIERYGEDCLFVGPQYGARLAALFNGCRALVLPSHVEGMPIVLLEALGYGAPILASDIPENRATAGEAATYFPTGDVEALSREIQLAWTMADGPQAKPVLPARHRWSSVAKATELLYAETLGRSGVRVAGCPVADDIDLT